MVLDAREGDRSLVDQVRVHRGPILYLAAKKKT